MIKVTLLGDSIRMIGYGLEVPALLGEDFEVFQPDDNCRFAKYTLEQWVVGYLQSVWRWVVHVRRGICGKYAEDCRYSAIQI